MLISTILLLIVYVGLLVLIAMDKMDRAALAIICSILAFFILLIFEQAKPFVIVEFLFGRSDDDYANFHTISLILGIMIISSICHHSGLFQYLAFKMIQLTKGDAKKVLITVCVFTYVISSILEDSITTIILVPLVITVCRTLQLPPAPYVISQALMIKLGATVFPISSVPSIMITTAQEISFVEYFLSAGLVSIVTASITILFLVIVFRKTLPTQKPKGLDSFLEYNARLFVKDWKMMIISLSIFMGILISLIVIPSNSLQADAIAWIGACILLIFNYKNAGEIIKNLDFNLIMYLLGIFILSGSLEYVGFINLISQGLTSLGKINIGIAFLAFLWIGALASAFIENIPITQLMIPLINLLLGVKGSPNAKFGSSGLALGIIWGDNLSPFGDTILLLNVARKNNVEIAPIQYAKYSTPITFLQLMGISVIVFLYYTPVIGLIVLSILIVILICGLLVFNYWKKHPENVKKLVFKRKRSIGTI